MNAEAEVIHRPQLASATSLPGELLDYFQSKHVSCSFQRVNESTSWSLISKQIEPFNVEETRESEPELFELLSRLRPNAQGNIVRGDATLCVQPVEAREQVQLFETQRREIQESGEKAQENVDEYLESELGPGARSIGDIPEVQVEVTKALLDLPRVK